MNQSIAETSFSVCIPNYNYAHYLPETLKSVLEQTHQNFEIIIADNASTDDSVKVAQSLGSDRIRIVQNRQNIGFAANLDRATESARNDHLLVLSSDDLMRPTALETYAKVLHELGPRADRAVLTSALDVIDGKSRLVGIQYRPAGKLFYREIPPEEANGIRWEALTPEKTPGEDALRESLRAKNSPASFLATCYSRKLYQEVEGYHSGYRMWPDSHFLNKLLSARSELIYVPQRLFAYRVHDQNQMATEAKSGALKYQVDAYLHTIEFPEDVLERLGLSRAELIDAFVEKALMERGLQAMAAHQQERALKCLAFGFATYPKQAISEPKTYALAGLLAMGPAGGWVANRLYRWHQQRRDRKEQPA